MGARLQIHWIEEVKAVQGGGFVFVMDFMVPGRNAYGRIKAVKEGGFVVDYSIPEEGTYEYGPPGKRTFTDWDELVAFLEKGILPKEAEG